MKQEILYGIHSVEESIKAGRRRFFDVYIKKDKPSKRLEEIASRAKGQGIKIHRIGGQDIKKIARTDAHQGVAATVGPYPIADIDELLSNSGKEKKHPFLLLLDTIVDPQNLGALIRTAVCADVHGIIVTKDRSSGLTPAVSRASAGALEHCRVAKVTNLAATIKALKKEGVWIAGMDREAPQTVFEADLSVPIAIVIGGEGKGLRPLVKTSCDLIVSIPQAGQIDSLNASAAGSVVMYEVYRQRNVVSKSK